MTGFGQASADVPGARVTVELRGVNHRFADVRLRMASEFAAYEAEVRRRILARIKRGRLEANVSIVPIDGHASRPRLDRLLLDEVLAAAETVRGELGVEAQPDVSKLLCIPGMFKTTVVETANDEDRHAALLAAVDDALRALCEERSREGKHLCVELLSRLETMTTLAARLRERAATIPANLRDRLVERLRALGTEIQLDPARAAQEAALLADRCDVTEELVRLDGHLQQATFLLGQPDGDPVGKRLEFLLQEISRETNTINAKSSDLELSRSALALKADVEKVREQIQNLE